MKTYARHRRLDELKQLCASQGITVNTDRHDDPKVASDFVALRGVFCGTTVFMVYSVINGCFAGEAAGGQRFSERSPLDGEGWFDAILDLLFVPKVPDAVAAAPELAEVAHG